MKDTCIFKECLVAKRLKLKKGEECINFIEAWWTPEGKKEPLIIKDCSPKRTFLMIQELYNRLIGVEKSQEQMRNEYKKDQMVLSLLSENIQLNFNRVIPKLIDEQKLLEIEHKS